MAMPTLAPMDRQFAPLAPGINLASIDVNHDPHSKTMVVNLELRASSYTGINGLEELVKQLSAQLQAITATSASTNYADMWPTTEVDEMSDEAPTPPEESELMAMRKELNDKLDEISQALRLLVDP